VNRPQGRVFPYTLRNPDAGELGLAPVLAVQLFGARTLTVNALVDSGAAVNTLPRSVGVELGYDWGRSRPLPALSGVIARSAARGIAVRSACGGFPPVLLVFAWAESDDVPVLLGRQNFFKEFDVCLFGSRAEFAVCPALKPLGAPQP
jgi:hypothetical protein